MEAGVELSSVAQLGLESLREIRRIKIASDTRDQQRSPSPRGSRRQPDLAGMKMI